MRISIRLAERNNEIIANCPELDINCYGKNKEEAVKRLKSIIHFYLDAAKTFGLDIEKPQAIAIEGETNYDLTDSFIFASPESIN